MGLIADEIHIRRAKQAQVRLFMVRADLIHPLASGNKFYKLSPSLEYAKDKGVKQLVSFGGAFSNHIYALALSAKAHGLSSVGIIRGEASYANNPTLTDAKNAGMQLEFVNRETYKMRHDSEYLEQLKIHYSDALIIPEGGSNQAAVKGCIKLAEEINNTIHADIITIAAGTGTTAAGLACGVDNKQTIMAYSVLKDETLAQRIQGFINAQGCGVDNVLIESADYGGYAKLDKALLDFIMEWLESTGILLDPIYTGKMCMRLMAQLESGYFQQGTRIAIVHSGGLQGWRGMQQHVIHLSGQKDWDKIQAYLCS